MGRLGFCRFILTGIGDMVVAISRNRFAQWRAQITIK